MHGGLGQFGRHHVVEDSRFQGYSVTFWGISSCKRNPLPLIDSEVDINFRLKFFELILHVTIHPNFRSPPQSPHLYLHHLVPHQPLPSLSHPHQYHLCLESLRCPYLGASMFASTPPWSYTKSHHQSQYRNYRTATCPVLVHPQSSAIQNHHHPLIILSLNPSCHTSVPVPLSVITTLMNSRIWRDHPNLGGSTWHTHRLRSTSAAYHPVALCPLRNAHASQKETMPPLTYRPQWSIHIAPHQVRHHRLCLKHRLCRALQDPQSSPPHLLSDMAAYCHTIPPSYLSADLAFLFRAEPALFMHSSMHPSIHLNITHHLACGYLTPQPFVWTISRSLLFVLFQRASIVLQCSFSYNSFASDSYSGSSLFIPYCPSSLLSI